MSYIQVASYKRRAREVIQHYLDSDRIRHEWTGKDLFVHPDDVDKFGKKYGWGAQQLNLFISCFN